MLHWSGCHFSCSNTAGNTASVACQNQKRNTSVAVESASAIDKIQKPAETSRNLPSDLNQISSWGIPMSSWALAFCCVLVLLSLNFRRKNKILTRHDRWYHCTWWCIWSSHITLLCKDFCHGAVQPRHHGSWLWLHWRSGSGSRSLCVAGGADCSNCHRACSLPVSSRCLRVRQWSETSLHSKIL